MPSTFCIITETEITAFLTERNFIEAVPLGHEKRFQRAEKIGLMPVTIYFLTSIAVGGYNTRDLGKDAMRLLVVGHDEKGNAKAVSRTKKFYRVRGWRRNVSVGIDHWASLVKYKCFKCHSPLLFVDHYSKKMYCVSCLYDITSKMKEMTHDKAETSN